MQNCDEASPSIIFAGRPLLVKLLITLEPHGTFRIFFLLYLCILTLYGHWYANGDEASPSIILPDRALLVKMLITLEQHCIF